MTLILAGLVVVTFGLIIERAGLVGYARQVTERASACVKVLRDSSLDDDAKERLMREQSVRLLGLLGLLIAVSALAILLPLGAVWLLEQIGVGSFDGVLAMLERPAFLVGASILGFATYMVIHRVRQA